MAKKTKLDWSGLGKKMEEASRGKRPTRQTDSRFYQQKFSEDGTAQTIIRFLPAPDTDIPITAIFNHRFNGPGGFYNQNCPTTIGQPCPVCDANRAIWPTNENLARTRSRKKKWIANIIVIRDPNCPENEGKVFLFRFPKTIYDKMWTKIQPPKGAVDDPVIVFDPEEGANFKLIAEQKKIKLGGRDVVYPDYKDSSFAEVSTLDNYEKDVEPHLFNLGEFTAEDQFKSYDELANRFAVVSGQSVSSQTQTTSAPTSTVEEFDDNTPPFDTSSDEKFQPETTSDGEDDDDFINKLRNKKKKQ
jgi:hypothetical protein